MRSISAAQRGDVLMAGGVSFHFQVSGNPTRWLSYLKSFVSFRSPVKSQRDKTSPQQKRVKRKKKKEKKKKQIESSEDARRAGIRGIRLFTFHEHHKQQKNRVARLTRTQSTQHTKGNANTHEGKRQASQNKISKQNGNSYQREWLKVIPLIRCHSFHGNIETRARPHHSSPRGISQTGKHFQASSFAISCLNARGKIKSASPFPSKSK